MKVAATSKRGRFDYHITQTIIAGIVLSGPEVKSVRAGHVQLKGSYVQVKNDGLWLVNTHISAYKYAQNDSDDPTRTRKLLVTKKQLKALEENKKNGLQLVPLAIGDVGGHIKVEVGIGQAKKLYDKRQTIKKRDVNREVNRDLRAKS